jgi:hypothetical protein
MTNAPQKNSPMLKVTGLWAKSSVKGGQYLTGRLGGLKVLVMENRDRQTDDDPSHHLFFVEAPDRRQGGQERGDGQRGQQAPQTRRGLSQAQRGGSQGHGQRPDWQAPLNRDDAPEPPAGADADDGPEWTR